jgi:hypothetical protein
MGWRSCSLSTIPRVPRKPSTRDAAKAFGVVVGPIDANAWGGIQVLSINYFLLTIYTGALNLFLCLKSPQAENSVGLLFSMHF